MCCLLFGQRRLPAALLPPRGPLRLCRRCCSRRLSQLLLRLPQLLLQLLHLLLLLRHLLSRGGSSSGGLLARRLQLSL